MGLESYRRSVSDSKRKAILDAARHVFLRDGYRVASVTEIARRADVSTATLYKHFASKEELFRTFAQEAVGRFDPEQQPAPSADNAEDAILAAVRAYLQGNLDRDVNRLLRLVIAEVPANPRLARDMFEHGIQRRYREFSGFLDRLVARGWLKPHDTERGARQIGGMLKEWLVWPALFYADYKLPADSEEIMRDAIRTYLARYGTA